MYANILEATYQRYQGLRAIALSVYAKKIEEYDNPDYEKICNIIAFEFDFRNQVAVAKSLGVSHKQLLFSLALLSTGARLLRQRK